MTPKFPFVGCCPGSSRETADLPGVEAEAEPVQGPQPQVAPTRSEWIVNSHELIPMPSRWRPATELGARYHRVVPAVWHLVIALLILNRFWYYWHTLP